MTSDQPGDRIVVGGIEVPPHLVPDGPPDIFDVNALMRLGLNVTQVAAVLGRDRTRIAHIRAECRDQAFLTPTEEVRAYWPWGKRTDDLSPPLMDARFTNATPCRRLRTHSRWYAYGATRMSEHAMIHLRGFHKLLRDNNYVIAFDPTLPPYPGMDCGGWSYKRRTDDDTVDGRDLMIRVDSQVTARKDDYFYKLWSFPRETV